MRVQFWRTLRNLLVLALASWLVWKLYDKTLWGTWSHVSAGWLLCALASTTVMLSVRTTKWHLLLAEDRIPRGRRESARALFGAYALASVTPGRVGDFGRFLFISEGRRARALLLTLVDKSFDLWALLTLAVGSLFLFVPVAIAAAVMAGWLVLTPLAARARHRVTNPRVGSKLFGRVHEILAVVNTVDARRFAALAVTTYVVDTLTLFFLLRAFHPAGLRVAFATYPWLIIAGSLPISFGGIGPREGLSALLLPVFSIPAAVAVNVSLTFFAVTLLLPAMFGTAWMALNPPKLGRRWWRNFRPQFGAAASDSTQHETAEG